MTSEIEQLQASTLDALQHLQDAAAVDALEINILGRKGKLAALLSRIPTLPPAERAGIGTLASEVKQTLQLAFNGARGKFSGTNDHSHFDPTWPGVAPSIGHLHPVTAFVERSVQFFTTLGYAVADGPEVETAAYNFDKLNIPANHPARDLWDTYYLNPERDGILMRTHTSPVQLRYMETHKPPAYVVVPGRVFRHEATDASHDTNFSMLEGLAIDRDLHITDLIGTLKAFLQHTFGPVKMRIRPSYFPFVEPGIEVDMSCLICHGKGCSVCKQTGWLEMLGAGMVHPVVLKNMKVDPKKYSGFAFGIGVERMVMLLHGIPEVRLLLSGDQRFLEQFHY
ncbi:MAG: phenylalanine--tRNA ligase subunit alpha [bacterium]|nr:phenylalanine--tRNA ligase subunit alpha [bacterium]